jgi:hypothetical protein
MSARCSRRSFVYPAAFFLTLLAAAGGVIRAGAESDRCLVPAAIRGPILNELSGEQALVHVQLLSANRDRQPEEYQTQFFETTYISDMARQYGLSDVRADFFPNRPAWDGEEGDLWLVQPTREKLASLTMVPAALAVGSRTADVEADVVYVGAGKEPDYAGKDVKGKIVLGNASVGSIAAVAWRHGAAGVLGTGSAGISGQAPGATLDQIGWSSVNVPAEQSGFGFSLSLRQFLRLRDLLDRGQRVAVRAHVRSGTFPGKMNVISAAIPGTDPAAGELLMVAHAFETIVTPGANDNCTGVGTTLEIGRTLARLIKSGELPPPRRTIRFLWVPEISGSTAYMFAHPDLTDRLLAALNFDMTGASTKATDTYLRMKMTPDSRPSYLNDLVASLLRFVDQSDIRSPQGQNAPFNYRLSPVAAIASGSDHSVFNDGGVPAMQFNYWADNFYHSSEDRVNYVDPTEMKRVGFVAAAAFYYLATAGPDQARDLAWESTANGERWIAEVAGQSGRLLGDDAALLPERYKAARNRVVGAYSRARGAVESVQRLAATPDVAATVARLVAALDASRDLNARLLDGRYAERAAALGTRPVALTLTEQERAYSRLVPRRLFGVYSQEARKRQAQDGGRGGRGARGEGETRRLPGLAASEVTSFIDGQRSILDIYNAVRAECGNLVVGNNDTKFGYVLSLDAPDVDLDLVYSALEELRKNGTIDILKVEVPRAAPKKAKK